MPTNADPYRTSSPVPRRAPATAVRRSRPARLPRILLAAAVIVGVAFLGAAALGSVDTKVGGLPASVSVGVLLAFACAFATQLSALFKHKGANDAPTVDIRRPFRTAWQLYSRKWFAIGMAIAAGAWLLHVAALVYAPLSLVQAVLSTGVVILAVMAARIFGFEVSLRQYVGVAMAALGLVLLVITLPVVDGAHADHSLTGILAFEGGLFALSALLIGGNRLGIPDRYRGVALGVAAGVLYAVSNVAIKALTGLGGISAIVVSPLVPVAIAASIVAFYASARGMQQGEAVPVLAATSTAANVMNILGGIVVFGDPMPSDPLSLGLQVLAFVLVIAAAVFTPPSADRGSAATAPSRVPLAS